MNRGLKKKNSAKKAFGYSLAMVFSMATLMAGAGASLGQPPVANTNPTSSPIATPPIANSPIQSITSTEAEKSTIRELQLQMTALQEKVEASAKSTDLLLPAIVIVLGIGTLGSLFGFIQTERRTSESHKLMVGGERSATSGCFDL